MLKPIEELTFIDDYMFGEVLKDKEICKQLLEILLGIKVERIEYPQLQKALKAGYTSHGIRLDVYVKDSDRVFDIEMQNKNYKELGLRTRFYQSLVDSDCLLRNKKYEDLPESFIIFICKGDPFNRNLPVYTFKRTCIEDSKFPLNDKSTFLFYNAKAYKNMNNPVIKAFLNFVRNNETTDGFSTLLANTVEKVKEDEIFKTRYINMSIWEMDIRETAIKEGLAEGRAEGLAEGKKETAINLYNEGISLDTISKCTGFSLEDLNELIKNI